MRDHGFTLDIMMELAGQSVANSVYHLSNKYRQGNVKNVLVYSGPGNNGMDGVVAARHLNMMGFNSTVVLFRQPTVAFFLGLLKACACNKVNVVEFSKLLEESNVDVKDDQQSEGFLKQYHKNFDLIVDSIFGFSFKPPIRKPYDQVLNTFKEESPEVLSVDIPSGWNVELGFWDIFKFR